MVPLMSLESAVKSKVPSGFVLTAMAVAMVICWRLFRFVSIGNHPYNLISPTIGSISYGRPSRYFRRYVCHSLACIDTAVVPSLIQDADSGNATKIIALAYALNTLQIELPTSLPSRMYSTVSPAIKSVRSFSAKHLNCKLSAVINISSVRRDKVCVCFTKICFGHDPKIKRIRRKRLSPAIA